MNPAAALTISPAGTTIVTAYPTMKVKDLIAALATMPADADVQVDLGEEFCGFKVEHTTAGENGAQLVALMLDPERMSFDPGLPDPRTLDDRVGEALRRLMFGLMRPLWADATEELRLRWRGRAANLLRTFATVGVKADII